MGYVILLVGFFAGNFINDTKMSFPLFGPLLDNWLPISILLVLIGNAGLFARIHRKFSSYVFLVLPTIMLLVYISLLLSKHLSREEPKSRYTIFLEWCKGLLGPGGFTDF